MINRDVLNAAWWFQAQQKYEIIALRKQTDGRILLTLKKDSKISWREWDPRKKVFNVLDSSTPNIYQTDLFK